MQGQCNLIITKVSTVIDVLGLHGLLYVSILLALPLLTNSTTVNVAPGNETLNAAFNGTSENDVTF